MDAEFKTRWTSALRSGKYKQGTKLLRGEVSGEPCFCPLGVLCDLIDPEGWGDPHTEGNMSAIPHHGQWAHPSQKILKQAGLLQVEADVISILGDEEKMSFDEIASEIDRRL